MSRATWYRLGKPDHKPLRITQARAASEMHVSVRSVQRARRLMRQAPELAAQVEAGTLTVGAAERLLTGAGAARQRAAQSVVLQEQIEAQRTELKALRLRLAQSAEENAVLKVELSLLREVQAKAKPRRRDLAQFLYPTVRRPPRP